MKPQHLLIVILLSLTGCHQYAPVEVHAFDAGTQQPLKGIPFESDVRYFLDPFHPKRDQAVTNDEGVAVLNVCTNYRSGGEEALLTSGYLLDEPTPKALVNLPLSKILAARGKPFRIDLGLLTRAEHRRRYPY